MRDVREYGGAGWWSVADFFEQVRYPPHRTAHGVEQTVSSPGGKVPISELVFACRYVVIREACKYV